MTEDVPVLNGPERLLATTLAALLGTGLVSAVIVEPPVPQVSAAVRTVSADVLPPVLPMAASPSATPTTQAPKKPAASGARKPAAAKPPPARIAAQPPQLGCPVPKRPTGGPYVPKPLPAPSVPDAALPAALPAGPKAASLEPVRGKGVWVTNFRQTPVDVSGLVAKARAAGLTSIWIRTGGRQGYYGDQFLPRLVPAAHAAGLQVIGWDFPFLSDPVADADRGRRAFDDGVDAFAPDIETTAEGTHATPQRVGLYLSLIRSYAGNRPIAATVPRPTPKRLKSFPYGSFPAYADVFAPMIYWSCNEPGRLVTQSLQQLGRLLPVAPVGQAYDMGDEGGRRGLPTGAETARFLDVARRGGAVGASLWTVERMSPDQLAVLTDYRWDSVPRD